MSARRDPFFMPVKKKPRAEETKEKEENYDEKDDEKQRKVAGGGFRAMLESHSSSQADTDAPADENADEKRIRMAKKYLESVRDELGGAAAEPEQIATKLFSETQKSLKAFRFIGSSVIAPTKESEVPGIIRAQREPITAVVVSGDGQFAYAASKDGTIMKFYIPANSRVATYDKTERRTGRGKMHTAQVFALALTSDGKILASGGEDRAIHLWDTEHDTKLDTLSGHRDAIMALAFRPNTRQLFSASRDRTVKVWNADSLAYVETLFGHQSEILGLDSFDRERVISVGSDSTCRVWKIVEQSQLVFHGHRSSIEAVAVINDNLWVAGGQDGAISLWIATKRAPIDFKEKAHSGCWITAVAACRRTDLIATGSNDGFVRLWSLQRSVSSSSSSSSVNSMGLPKLKLEKQIPIKGFINGLSFSSNGDMLVIGVGQEHRLGRWQRALGAKNGLFFVPLSFSSDDKHDDTDENDADDDHKDDD